MRYITLGEALELYRRVIAQSGGLRGIHDLCFGISISTTAYDVQQSRTVPFAR